MLLRSLCALSGTLEGREGGTGGSVPETPCIILGGRRDRLAILSESAAVDHPSVACEAVERYYAALFPPARGTTKNDVRELEERLLEKSKPSPNPTPCLLYTSPSPRD